MHNFREFQVWKRGINYCKSIYNITSSFSVEEKFGIVSQIRRSAVSIPSNIAEGAGRNTNKEFARFLSISLGSQFELETQLIISEQIGQLSKSGLSPLIDEINEIQKMTRRLIEKFST